MTRLFPDGKTVFIPADGQPMPGYEQARAEIEARGGQVQVAGGGFGIFSWLFGARGGGADDAEEEGGQEATTTGNARGGRGGGGGVAEPQVQVADAGPEAVAKAKRNLPTGPAYAELRRTRARRQIAGSRRRARGSRRGQAQLADRSGLRQRRRAGAGAPGQAGGGRDVRAARRRQRRFARSRPTALLGPSRSGRCRRDGRPTSTSPPRLPALRCRRRVRRN